jgi:hypothetical protein
MRIITAIAIGSGQGQGIQDLAFMSGCWEGSFQSRNGGTGVIEEQYTTPSDNVMLGTTRYLLDGRAVMFELATILRGDSGVVLTPYPRGRASEHGFRLTSADGASAMFEAPEHDFPKRISYRLQGDTLVARIDDGSDTGQAQTWRMVRCRTP